MRVVSAGLVIRERQAKHVRNGIVRGHERREALGQPSETFVDDCLDQLWHAAETAVHDHRRNADRRGDSSDLQRLWPILGEQLDRCLNQALMNIGVGRAVSIGHRQGFPSGYGGA